MLYIESHAVLVGYRQSRVPTDEVPLLVLISAELICYTAFHPPSSLLGKVPWLAVNAAPAS